MHSDPKKAAPSADERRNSGERRSDDRRAHERFEPHSPSRNDRRQRERRGTR
jgi:hypothetical protein